jgi:hypothetical protein
MRAGSELQKNAVLLEDEAFVAGEFEVGTAERIGGEPLSIGFVGCHAVCVVDAISDRRRIAGRAIGACPPAAGRRRDAGDDLDLEIKTGKPVDAY